MVKSSSFHILVKKNITMMELENNHTVTLEVLRTMVYMKLSIQITEVENNQKESKRMYSVAVIVF